MRKNGQGKGIGSNRVGARRFVGGQKTFEPLTSGKERRASTRSETKNKPHSCKRKSKKAIWPQNEPKRQ